MPRTEAGSTEEPCLRVPIRAHRARAALGASLALRGAKSGAKSGGQETAKAARWRLFEPDRNQAATGGKR
jgi:hypothetical protein